jgi:hypothetical protein
MDVLLDGGYRVNIIFEHLRKKAWRNLN